MTAPRSIASDSAVCENELDDPSSRMEYPVLAKIIMFLARRTNESSVNKNRIKSLAPIDLCNIRFTQAERQSLRSLFGSGNGNLRIRRQCVDYLREGVGVRGNRQFIFDMCDLMIPDRSAYVRWQSLLVLGGYVSTHARELWPLVLKWGTHPSYDIRRGVACCVLEHVLEYHFRPWFDKACAHIDNGNRRFAYTLAYCWRFGDAQLPANAAQFDAFKRHAFPHGVKT